MKILCVADHNDPLVYSLLIKKRFKDVSLILACGDLRLSYFDFIISNLNKPLFFVFGNHHLDQLEYYERNDWQAVYNFKIAYPQFKGVGAQYIDHRCVFHNNLLIMGFGGSMRYNKGKHQFTEIQMTWRVIKTIPRLLYNKVRYKRYLDILITHAPPFEIHDQPDCCHRGFKIFRWFMRVFEPRYLIHGHVHLYSKNKERIDKYHNTLVLNAYDHYVLEIKNENTKST